METLATDLLAALEQPPASPRDDDASICVLAAARTLREAGDLDGAAAALEDGIAVSRRRLGRVDAAFTTCAPLISAQAAARAMGAEADRAFRAARKLLARLAAERAEREALAEPIVLAKKPSKRRGTSPPRSKARRASSAPTGPRGPVWF